jgi:hypothetical protein
VKGTPLTGSLLPHLHRQFLLHTLHTITSQGFFTLSAYNITGCSAKLTLHDFLGTHALPRLIKQGKYHSTAATKQRKNIRKKRKKTYVYITTIKLKRYQKATPSNNLARSIITFTGK